MAVGGCEPCIEILAKNLGMSVDDGLGKEIVDMCNASEAVYERGYKRGYERGYKKGYERGYKIGYERGFRKERKCEIAMTLLKKGADDSMIMRVCELSESDLQKIKDNEFCIVV